MVYIGPDLVDVAPTSAATSIACRAGTRHRDVVLELGNLAFQTGTGSPHAADLERGCLPGSAHDYRELTQIAHHFDVFQMMASSVEPQDVPTHLRHYFTTETQMTLTDKFPFEFARGTPQALDDFEMLRVFWRLPDGGFQANTHCFTIINTKSPRTLGISMAQGLIGIVRHGQLSVVTPFTLMGAMAPITVAGTFTSNFDMISGAPAFGTRRIGARRRG